MLAESTGSEVFKVSPVQTDILHELHSRLHER